MNWGKFMHWGSLEKSLLEEYQLGEIIEFTPKRKREKEFN